jgi:hypothetical protein
MTCARSRYATEYKPRVTPGGARLVKILMSSKRSFAVCAISLLFSGLAPGQVTSGTILGTVTDSSNSSVPNAKIRITNSGTGIASDIKSNSDGNYELPYLIAGEYEVAVEAPGFKSFRQTKIMLNTDEKYRVDVKLEVGNASQTVTVAASSEVLQTDASEMSQTVDRRTIESLPNINDNPLIFAMTMSGVVTTGAFLDPNNVNTGDNSRQYFSGFTVNGSRPISSNISLDGAFNTNGYVNEIAVIPARDAIAEVKVITNAYSAEYGRAGGGVINFTTRSGDNVLHGSLFENFRNSDLNANSFGNNTFGTDSHGNPLRPRPPFSTNSFGGTLGGPVVLPKIYDGHNKTFFFFSYQGLRRSQGNSTYYTVPTALERVGDFSQTLAAVNIGGQQVAEHRQIYLPLPNTTTVTTVGTGQYQYTRQQASSGGILNKIPTQDLDPVALKLMSYYPLPNITPLNIDGTNNYFTNAPTYTRSDQIIVKLDRQITVSQKLFFRWTTDWTLSNPPNIFSIAAANNNGPTTQFNPSATIGYDWAISARSMLEIRASMTRINLILIPAGGLNYLETNNPGFSPQEVAAGATQVFPRINISPYPSEGTASYIVRNNHSTNYSFTPNYTKLLNKWTLKLGGEYLALYNNFVQPQYGSFALTNGANSFTQACEGTGCAGVPANTPQGWGAAGFLMGVADGAAGNGEFVTGDPPMALKNPFYAVYSQNDWKATRNLTINIGLRYEYQGSLTERNNHLSQFILSGTNPTGTNGLYEFSGVNGDSRGQTNSDKTNFAPRVGFAYRLGDKTVIRSAYGISYDMITGMGSGAQGFGSDGFSKPAYVQIRPSTGITNGLDILIAPFENAFSAGGVAAAPNALNPVLLGNSPTAIIKGDSRTPYVQQWNFTIQRLLPWGMDAQVAYVGTKGTFLSIQQHPVNQTDDIPPATLNSAIATYQATGLNPLTTAVPNPFYGIITNNTNLKGSTILQQYLDLPYPAYGAFATWQGRIGDSNYNSLQATVKHMFRHGFQIGGAYTWSKSTNDGGSYAAQIQGGFSQGSFYWDPNNRRLDRSISSFDVPQRLVLNYLWELPFGKGQPIFNRTPVLSQALGGWKVAGITMFSDGFPIGITGGGFGRPNIIGNPVLPKKDQIVGNGVTAVTLPDGTKWVEPAGYKLYFNPDAFAEPVITVPRAGTTGQFVNVLNPYTYGDAPRLFNDIRAPGIDNWDLNVSRIITLRERLRLEIRADAYNALNRVQIGAPSSGFGGPDVTTPGRLGMNNSTTFGSIPVTTAQTAVSQVGNSARYMQLSLRLSW